MSSTQVSAPEARDGAAPASPSPAAASPRRYWVALMLIVAGALTLRVVYVLADRVGAPVQGDAVYYSLQAAALADGRGFTCPLLGVPSVCPKKVPAADHPPMTALSLTPAEWLYASDRAKLLSTALYGTVGVLVIGLLGRRVAGDRAGLIAAGLAAVYPNLWINDGLMMSETLAALSVALALLFTYRIATRPSFANAVILGGVCGLMTLTRAELGLFIPIVALPVVLLVRTTSLARRLAVAGVVAVSAVALLATWVVPNMIRFEKPVYLSTNDGVTIAGANNPTVYSGPALGLWTLAKYDTPKGDQSVVDSYLRHQGLSYARHHLRRLPVVIAAREGLVWSVYRPSTSGHYNRGEGRELWASWLGFGMYWALVPLAIGGLLVLRRRHIMVWPLVAQFAMVTITAAAFYGLIRFRIPAEVALVVLAAAALDYLVGHRRVVGAAA